MSESRSVFDLLRARGEEFFNQMAGELMANPRFMSALQTAMRGKERLDQAAAQALKSMNVPTRSEFKRAVARIDSLEHELAELRKAQASRPPAPRVRRAKARPRAKAE